jgi:hypothetical protein
MDAALAQLRLGQPLVAARGDRFVLRRETTLGGGVVLDPAPPRHADPRRIGRASVYAPVPFRDVAVRGLDAADLQRAGQWVFAPAWLADVRNRVQALLASRERDGDPGLPATALVGEVPWSREVLPLLGLKLVGARYYLPDQEPPAAPRGEVRLGDGTVISRERYERARDLLVEECERAGAITLGRFRDLVGESRRLAQLLLERFDVDRVTLRVGDERRLRRSFRDRAVRRIS